MSVYYPIFVDLARRRCLIVGGGLVAERKALGLLEAMARVTVVSPALTAQLRRWALAGLVTHRPRPFEAEDVEGCALVIAATDRGAVNTHVARVARRRGIWVNVVDTPEECDFIAPAVVRRGALQLAISTGGNSPMLAKRLRQGLEALIGPEYGDLTALLGALRAAARVRGEPSEAWQTLLQQVIEESGLPLLTEVTVAPR